MWRMLSGARHQSLLYGVSSTLGLKQTKPAQCTRSYSNPVQVVNNDNFSGHTNVNFQSFECCKMRCMFTSVEHGAGRRWLTRNARPPDSTSRPVVRHWRFFPLLRPFTGAQQVCGGEGGGHCAASRAHYVQQLHAEHNMQKHCKSCCLHILIQVLQNLMIKTTTRKVSTCMSFIRCRCPRLYAHTLDAQNGLPNLGLALHWFSTVVVSTER